MSSDFQTIAALVVVAAATVWLLARAFRRRRQSGCGDGCSADSREVKELQARLKSRG